jgi:hypothetical protein
MSADNGIYILKTIRTSKQKDIGWVKTEPYPVYRVSDASAIENFDWYKKNQPYNLGGYMKDIWGGCKVYEDEQEALNHATQLEKVIPLLEYGICRIDTDYIFYGDM